MASLNQLVSEFAHSLGQPNNYALRENIRSLVIHTRNEIIRRSYENHGYVDKILTQRYKVSLKEVTDGEINPSYVTEVITIPERTEEEIVVLRRGRTIPITNRVYGRVTFASMLNYSPANKYNLDADLLSVVSTKIKQYGTPGFYIKKPVSFATENLDVNMFILGVAGNTTCDENDTEGFYYIIVPPVKKEVDLKLTITTQYANPAMAIRELVGPVEGEGGDSHNTTRVVTHHNEVFEGDNSIYIEFTQTPLSGYRIFTFTGPTLPYRDIILQSANNIEDNEFIYEKDVTETRTKVIPASTEEVRETVKGIHKIRRTVQKVPRPVRLTNNLPFDRVSSVGYKTNREFPYIKETSARFRSKLPGMCGMPCYDYINGYIYLFPADNRPFELDKIIIEGAFEHPTQIEIANGEKDALSVELYDNDEWLLSEDMIGQIKDIIYKRDLLNTVRQTNEIPNEIKYN